MVRWISGRLLPVRALEIAFPLLLAQSAGRDDAWKTRGIHAHCDRQRLFRARRQSLKSRAKDGSGADPTAVVMLVATSLAALE
jgi:hypothetical protein